MRLPHKSPKFISGSCHPQPSCVATTFIRKSNHNPSFSQVGNTLFRSPRIAHSIMAAAHLLRSVSLCCVVADDTDESTLYVSESLFVGVVVADCLISSHCMSLHPLPVLLTEHIFVPFPCQAQSIYFPHQLVGCLFTCQGAVFTSLLGQQQHHLRDSDLFAFEAKTRA